jgi:hypothetical protein
MESLNINGTEYTPKVTFDTKSLLFEISGESRPENTGKFYEPIINWLNQYQPQLTEQKNAGKPSNIIFEFKLEYYNSTSAKYILDILTVLDTYHANGHTLTIKWNYDSQDTDMLESGEEFAKLLNVGIELIPKS